MEYLKKRFKFKYGNNKYRENYSGIFKAQPKQDVKNFKRQVKIWPKEDNIHRRGAENAEE